MKNIYLVVGFNKEGFTITNSLYFNSLKEAKVWKNASFTAKIYKLVEVKK